MVKLIFNPPVDKNQIVVESCVSKKKEVNLNPFSSIIPIEHLSLENEPSVKEIIGLENCAYVLNDWYTKNNPKILL